MESFDLESAGAHARSFLDVGQGHFMGGDFEPWRLGAWAAAHETIPKSCFGISVQIHKDAASWSGLGRGGTHARSPFDIGQGHLMADETLSLHGRSDETSDEE